MVEKREIDLPPGAVRDVPLRPLDRPERLWKAMAAAVVFIAIGAYAAWVIGTVWSPLLVAPGAIIFGVATAGMWPAVWFRTPPRS